MNIYLLNKAPTDIGNFLAAADVQIWTDMTHIPETALHGFSLSALERVDAVILEISYPADELHYILAQAIVLQRPTLCLYPKNREPREMLLHLQKPTVPKSVIARSYTNTTLKDVLSKFLQSIDHSVKLEDTPNIKFTLRLTQALEHYLDWLAQYKEINKADYIRKLLKEDADKNRDYQKLL